jgi:ribosomal protein L11 methyltransferase
MQVDQVSVPLTRENAYALVDAVMERDDLALTASAHEDEDAGLWVFEATCESPPDLEGFAALARAVLGADVDFTVEPVDPAVNWVARSLEGLAPVVAGRFFIYGSHETAPPPRGYTALRIDAAQAFGTGHHQTTTGCLEAAEMVLRRRRPRRVIDVGTGTGVLALGIARRLRRRVIGTDIDPIAVVTAVANARDNELGPKFTGICAAGLDHRAISAGAPYDFLLANILAGPLVALAPRMAALAAPGADIVLSGILAPQARRVLNAYRAQGLILEKRLQRREWTTLWLRRPGRG